MGNSESTHPHTSSFNTNIYQGGGRGKGIIGEGIMRPSQLRFTQSSISSRFQDGHTLDETFRQFLYREISMGRYEQVPRLVVMKYQGHWFVLRGNRRLYLMKKLEEIGSLHTVKVLMKSFDQEEFNKQFSTVNMGQSVNVRGDPYIEQKLNTIVAEWRSKSGYGEGGGRAYGQNNDWCIIL